MIREQRARWLALGTAVLVAVLAGLFAVLRNASGPAAAARNEDPVHDGGAGAPAVADPARLVAGRAAFERLRCAGCHAIGGIGNPSHSLDGVGGRLDRASLRAWSIGAGAAAEALPARVLARKQASADDPRLEELLDFLQASR